MVVDVSGIGSHSKQNGGHEEWLTPPEIVKALGPFDLDPCSPIVRPWDTATNHFNVNDNGLYKAWRGKVWLNPPYGPKCAHWLARLAEHGDGIALVFARTETQMFFDYVCDKCDAMLFIPGRLHFHFVGGQRAESNSGAPSVLIAYGTSNAVALRDSGIAGKFIVLNGCRI